MHLVSSKCQRWNSLDTHLFSVQSRQTIIQSLTFARGSRFAQANTIPSAVFAFSLLSLAEPSFLGSAHHHNINPFQPISFSSHYSVVAINECVLVALPEQAKITNTNNDPSNPTILLPIQAQIFLAHLSRVVLIRQSDRSKRNRNNLGVFQVLDLVEQIAIFKVEDTSDAFSRSCTCE